MALIVYSDFQCPYCGKFAREILPEIERKYVITGKVRVVFKHLPLESIHASAFGASEAAECGGQQRQFWPMHDLLFTSQTSLGQERYAGYAREIKLDEQAFKACLGGKVADKVRADVKASEELGITATPTILIGRVDPTNAVRVMERSEGAGQVAMLSGLIDKVLSSTESARR